LQSTAATNLQLRLNPKVWDGLRFLGGTFMADDMEKKGQQGNQYGQGQQSGQLGQHGQQGGQSGQPQQGSQSGQNQPKKTGQGQNETQEDDQNRDRQRRAS
jgi:hypothetical protein